MLDSYMTIKQDGQHEMEIKKSKFICFFSRVDSEVSAKNFIQLKKKEHWKANHNCSAFIVGAEKITQHSSDDGEPSGTAGTPMLEILKKKQLSNVVVVVTRYFGGTKLGTGGLIRAYSHAVSETIDMIGLVKGQRLQEITIELQYSLLGKLQNFLEHSAYLVKDTIYTEKICVTCMIAPKDNPQFQTEILNLLNGQCQFVLGTFSYFETSY